MLNFRIDNFLDYGKAFSLHMFYHFHLWLGEQKLYGCNAIEPLCSGKDDICRSVVFYMQNLTQNRVLNAWWASGLVEASVVRLLHFLHESRALSALSLCTASHARFKDNEDGMQEARQIFTQLDDLDKEDMNMNHKTKKPTERWGDADAGSGPGPGAGRGK